MGVKIKNGLSPGIYTGTDILDAASLGDSKKKETDEVAESIEKADGFAQVFPEHKFHIVDVLKKHGHMVFA